MQPEIYDVGGIPLARPFKISRLGHFGFYARDMAKALFYYKDLLGFLISDPHTFAHIKPEAAKEHDPIGYFMRYQSDHHAFALFPRPFFEAATPLPPQQWVNQITWQVGSLKEVVDGEEYFRGAGVTLDRVGRDMPGSNWHTYMYDLERNRNELFYGMEQVGWDGRTKPMAMHVDHRLNSTAVLPQPPEWREVDIAVEKGIKMHSGRRHTEELPLDYELGGILMPRPFKITAVGPVRLVCRDIEAQLAFYQEKLGFTVTESGEWNGHAMHFLRCNTDHHALALYPKGILEGLGLPHTNTQCFSFGVRVYDYRQLCDAEAFLQQHGVPTLRLPPELTPGMDHTFFAADPDGNLTQFYYHMEQIGWDGRPRPAELRPAVDNADWPATVPAQSDSFGGAPLLGPWG